MWPSLGPDSIVFENGGYLYSFDLDSKQPKKLTLSLPGDARPEHVEVVMFLATHRPIAHALVAIARQR